MKLRKTLYEMNKGKQMHEQGYYQATKTEDFLVKAVGLFFTLSVIMTLLSSFLDLNMILIPSVICLIVSFIGMFVVMFGIVFLKSRKEPLEKHYYDVDYRYDGVKGEVDDKSHEISKEEFFGKKQD